MKEGSDSWSGLVREVQSMVPDVKHLRIKANETINSLSLADQLGIPEIVDNTSNRSHSISPRRSIEQKCERAHG